MFFVVFDNHVTRQVCPRLTHSIPPRRSSDRPDLLGAVERWPKPIVAAVHNAALGGGLVVALGCQFRIATPSARLGLPEVSLGLLPGAGGTQQLPRLIGAGPALAVIVGGAPVSGKRAPELGLVARLADPAPHARPAIYFSSTLSPP